MMRAMVLEFPDDPACTHLERQYMLGDDLLVAPVFRADGDVSYYVPDGTWTHVLTGAEVTGPRWHREQHSFLSVPLLARPGAVIPVGAVEDRPDYDYADGVTLQVYQLADGASRIARIPVADPRLDPPAFTVTRTGPVIRVAAAGASIPRRWQVLLVGIRQTGRVAGGTAAAHPQGSPPPQVSPPRVFTASQGTERWRSGWPLSQQIPHPGQQIIRVERLGQVAVGAGVQAARDVRLLHAGAHQQHREMLGDR